MEATTTDDVREHFRPGDVVINSRAERHTVTAVMHTGHGFRGVMLTVRTLGNGSPVYAVWVVDVGGRVRNTMASQDFSAVHGAFTARVSKALQIEI